MENTFLLKKCNIVPSLEISNKQKVSYKKHVKVFYKGLIRLI